MTPQTGDYQFSQIGGTILSNQLPSPGGDLTGRLEAATVSGLQSRPLAAMVPAVGQVLTWSGVQWEPEGVAAGVTSAFGRSGAVSSQAGDYSFSQISGTVSSSQLPPPGGDLSGTFTAATVSQLQNRPVAATAPTAGQVLTWSGTQWQPGTGVGGVTSAFGRSGAVMAQAGDYSAAQITNGVDRTQPNSYAAGAKQSFIGNAASAGLQVSPTSLPSTAQAGDMVMDAGDSNQLKIYNGSSWVGTTPVPAHANYAMSFSGQTVVSIAGSTHQLGTANLIVGCYDNNMPANMIEPSTVSVNPSTYDVTVQFPAAQSGRCVINGFNGGTGMGTGGTGAVSTVFGRIGDVTAKAGDYAFPQISGTVANSQVAGRPGCIQDRCRRSEQPGIWLRGQRRERHSGAVRRQGSNLSQPHGERRCYRGIGKHGGCRDTGVVDIECSSAGRTSARVERGSEPVAAGHCRERNRRRRRRSDGGAIGRLRGHGDESDDTYHRRGVLGRDPLQRWVREPGVLIYQQRERDADGRGRNSFHLYRRQRATNGRPHDDGGLFKRLRGLIGDYRLSGRFDPAVLMGGGGRDMAEQRERLAGLDQ